MDNDIQERMKNHSQWYGDAKAYWKTIPATDDGMLGGFNSISKADAEGSKKFLSRLKTQKILNSGFHRALDCGAGIGRVTKNALLPLFEQVDLVEQNEEFLKAAEDYLGEDCKRVGNYFSQGLQDFKPKVRYYDVIWIQWVIGHLTDDDFVNFLQRCRAGLVPGGCICLKENIATGNEVLDEEDSSVTRTHTQFMSIFKRAGLKIHLTESQRGFPKQIFKVNMYAVS